jgi:hypothetical protein
MPSRSLREIPYGIVAGETPWNIRDLPEAISAWTARATPIYPDFSTIFVDSKSTVNKQ